jgi:carboxypeptidase C (cathepsin A)
MRLSALACLLALGLSPVWAAPTASDTKHDATPEDGDSPRILRDESQTTSGALSVRAGRTAYQAEAGIQVIYLKDPKDDDPPQRDEHGNPPPAALHAGMSYVAYFKGDHEDPRRPITFLFNGGPGSSTVWLHMGAFGPKRVVTADDSHSPAAPYRLVDNEYSLLDASDLVFIDAPGTGFGHLRGADKEKTFYATDADAHAFANFIVAFLAKHGRWNSPKYVFGESYGTLRAALLANVLQGEKSLDLNGVIFLSQILNYSDNADTPQYNPGVDQPYVLALPSYTATAWYHHRLPNQPAALEPLLAEVEHFATNEYFPALLAGNTLPPQRLSEIAARLHEYTGLPADYIERANLRINVGQFEKNLLGADTTTGRLDSRFAGPTLDPLSKEAEYDPQSAAIASAYVSAFNDYVRRTLHFGVGMTYKEGIDAEKNWDFLHQPPGASSKQPQAPNVMPDLAVAMKQNPRLKVMMNGGYYDLATPFFSAMYELQHLPLQPQLQKNIEMHFYTSGHMVYAHEPDLKSLHDNVADFIGRTHGSVPTS